jgi:hypothetical protein
VTNVDNDMLWVQKHREYVDTPTVTLAIQTIRNTAIVAIFIGGYAFQNTVATITTFSQTPPGRTDLKISKGVTAMLMFLSFLCWAVVIRSAAHLGFYLDVISFLAQKLREAESGEFTVKENALSNSEYLRSVIDSKVKACQTFVKRLEFCFR